MNPQAFSIIVIIGSILLAVIVMVAWYALYRKPRDRGAPHRLGRQMGLRLLNEDGRSGPAWYGGRYRDHEFGLTYYNLHYGSYRRRPALSVEDVILSLRLALALNVAGGPRDIIAYFHHGREFKTGVEPPDFEYAFDRRNTGRLSEESRRAMLRFAQNYGSLRLRDRADAPQGLFAAEALPDAQVVLVHDRPGHKQSPQEVAALLDALLEVAEVLEADVAYVN